MSQGQLSIFSIFSALPKNKALSADVQRVLAEFWKYLQHLQSIQRLHQRRRFLFHLRFFSKASSLYNQRTSREDSNKARKELLVRRNCSKRSTFWTKTRKEISIDFEFWKKLNFLKELNGQFFDHFRERVNFLEQSLSKIFF